MEKVGFALTAGGIVITSGTAFWIASWHRRQMRQNEAFRLDPSAGLHPPLTGVERFLKIYWLGLIGFVLMLANLVYDDFETGPITRATIIKIAVDTALLIMNLTLLTVVLMLNKQGRVLLNMLQLMKSTRDSKRP